MKRKGHAVRYPPCDDSAMAKFYNYLLEEGHVDSKLPVKVLDACPTLFDKVNFLTVCCASLFVSFLSNKLPSICENSSNARFSGPLSFVSDGVIVSTNIRLPSLGPLNDVLVRGPLSGA